MSTSSVLYDAPGPIALRRQRILSMAIGLVIAIVVAVAAIAMYRNNIFNDRWLVLVDPPRGQTVVNVWWDSLLIRGLVEGTLKAALLAIPLSAALALFLAILRTSRRRLVSAPTKWIIELLRGLPVLIMMLFGLIALGLSSLWAVVFGLVLYNAAVFAEILRAGLASLAKGQGEAGIAIGLTTWQNLRIIMLPQAIRVMLPSLISQLIVLVKDTSIGFIVGYPELLRAYQLNYSFFGNEARLPLFVATLFIFLVVNISLSRLAVVAERRLSTRGQKVKLPTAVAVAVDPANAASPAAGDSSADR